MNKLLLSDINPDNQLFIINQFHKYGYTVHEDTTKYDPEFPYLYYDIDYDFLCQTQSLARYKVIENYREFLSHVGIPLEYEIY